MHPRLLVAVAFLAMAVACIGPGAASEAATDVVNCPECEGVGSVVCAAHCKDGKTPCPETCLKKDDPGWVAGPEGKTVKYFPSHKPGIGGSVWYSTAHLGQLIVYEDGLAVNKGVCPTCHGTGIADCKECNGMGRVTCALCKGEKHVGSSEAVEYVKKRDAAQKAAEAALKKQQDEKNKKQQDEKKAKEITLKDGTILCGKVIGRTADKVIIKTDAGPVETVDASDIVSPVQRGPASSKSE